MKRFELSIEEQQALAGLTQVPGFQILLKVFKAEEEELLNQLGSIGTTDDLVKAARYWQVVRHIGYILETTPQSIQNVLDTLEQEGQKVYDEVTSPIEDWRCQIARPQLVRNPRGPESTNK